MSTKKKLFQAAAGSAGGAGLDIPEVFSTFIHEGDSTTKSIVNGIDLQNEGGLIFSKSIDAAVDWGAYDTDGTGTGNELKPNSNGAMSADSDLIQSFNANGFTTGPDVQLNQSARGTYCTWTFRKAPKFFDIVTYTGNQVSGRTLSHNLGSTPGMIMIKKLDTSEDWSVFHRDLNTNSGGNYTQFIKLNSDTSAFGGTGSSASTCEDVQNVSSTTFTIGNDNRVNTNTSPYVAYLFAHNDGDGEFGPNQDQDIIKCGTWTGNGTQPSGTSINLGFEPQFIMWKRTDSTGDWYWVDNLRGFDVTNQANKVLKLNTSDIQSSGDDYILPSPTGFDIEENLTVANANGGKYIYMAIRRGPLAEPESATDVFAINTMQNQEPTFVSNFVVDFALRKDVAGTSDWFASSRLTQGRYLRTNQTSSETSNSTYVFDYMDGWYNNPVNNSDQYSWMWKRAPGYFDVVAYTGTGSNRTVSHNLGVAPEMIWIKDRDNVKNWPVRVNNDYYRYLNQNLEDGGSTFYSAHWASSDPTDSVFHVGSNDNTNGSGTNYIAYLFATLAGISKVGSYTGNGTNQNIECGFSSGARFVLIKRTDATGDWWIIDTARGLVAGADERLKLNSNDVQLDEDSIDPYSGGFNVVQETYANLNVNNASYIFYAIA